MKSSPLVQALILCCALHAAPALASGPACGDVHDAIKWSQDWLVNNQRPNGWFAYEYRPVDDAYPDDDNIVRQIGTFWALISTLPVYSGPERSEAIRRFRAVLSKHLVRAKAEGQDIAFIEHEGVGKVNAAALALLALLALEEQGFALTPKERGDATLLAAGIRLMATGKGGYWYIYFLPSEKNHVTPYGSGEALLALAAYAAARKDDALRQQALEEFQLYYEAYLRGLTSFNSTYLRGFFSWGLMALARMSTIDAFIYHRRIRPLLKVALKHRSANPDCADKGCIERNNVTDAPFLEGFVTAYPYVLRHEKDAAFRLEVKNYVELATERLMQLQATPRHVPSGLAGIPHKNMTRVYGGLCWDDACKLMRNDMNQHGMMALNYYRQAICP